jgi:hypothetical protein
MKATIGYRTTHPEVLTAWDAWQDEMRAHHARIRAFKERIDPDDQLRLHVRRNNVPAYFSGDVVPDGWRRNANGNIVPNKRLKAGKLAEAELEELRRGAPRDVTTQMKGMPAGPLFVGSGLYEPGAFKHDGAVYVHWGCVPEGVDASVWTELKMSELYAAKEAHDEVLEHAA